MKTTAFGILVCATAFAPSPGRSQGLFPTTTSNAPPALQGPLVTAPSTIGSAGPWWGASPIGGGAATVAPSGAPYVSAPGGAQGRVYWVRPPFTNSTLFFGGYSNPSTPAAPVPQPPPTGRVIVSTPMNVTGSGGGTTSVPSVPALPTSPSVGAPPPPPSQPSPFSPRASAWSSQPAGTNYGGPVMQDGSYIVSGPVYSSGGWTSYGSTVTYGTPSYGTSYGTPCCGALMNEGATGSYPYRVVRTYPVGPRVVIGVRPVYSGW